MIANMKSLLGLVMMLLGMGVSLADVIYIEACTSSGAPNAGPNYSENTGTWGWSSAESAVGLNTGNRSRFSTTAGASFSVSPVLRPGARYQVSITCPNVSVSTNILVGISVVGGSFSTNQTDAFQSSKSANHWAIVGILTVSLLTNQPTVTFTHIGGTVTNSSSQRFYADTFLFMTDCGCQDGPEISTVLNTNRMSLYWIGTVAAVQSSTNLSNGFVDLPGPVRNAPYSETIDAAAPQKFFRVRK